jgi:hypothetical protein
MNRTARPVWLAVGLMVTMVDPADRERVQLRAMPPKARLSWRRVEAELAEASSPRCPC